MIKDKHLKLIIDRSKNICRGYRIYEFSPSLLRMFYKNYEKLTLQRWVRFFFELLKGYKVYYLEVNGFIVAYSVISRGGGRYSFADVDDIVVGPYFVLEAYRGNRYSEVLVAELLHYNSIEYKNAYDWVRKTNIPSLKCSDKVGLKVVGSANIIGPFRKIVLCDHMNGEYLILKEKREYIQQLHL